ncbi:MAG: hypothetical protein U9O95_06290 [Candidatus Marinimicrobia bacterium]|nr:hypothetical protein [Candidatus Neomarinimicrobiota bacterium]
MKKCIIQALAASALCSIIILLLREVPLEVIKEIDLKYILLAIVFFLINGLLFSLVAIWQYKKKNR